MRSETYKQLIAYLQGKEVIRSHHEFKQRELGESYYSLKILGSSLTVDVTHLDGNPVVIFNVSDQYNIVPVTSIQEYTKTQNGDIIRIILRINDEFELLNEDVMGIMMGDLAMLPEGFPKQDRPFKPIPEEYYSLV